VAELLTASVLSDDEKIAIRRLSAKIRADLRGLKRLDNYYEAAQRVKHIGIALPPELAEDFTVILNVPRMAVDEPVRRQKLRFFYRVGDQTQSDPALMEAWEYNNLGSKSALASKETRIFGRSWGMVGTNPDEQGRPLITLEDPRNLACDVDAARGRVRAGLRQYRDESTRQTLGTLYLPDSTVHIARGTRGWDVVDRDDHGLGVVPIVGFLNRPRTGNYAGTSEMADVIGPTDAIARMITNMGVSGDTHAVPSRWAAGVAKSDFVDADGKMLPIWEAYFTAIRATENKDAKFGQFEASDLSNFHASVNNLLAWCALMLGLPTRYTNPNTVNPASEGAIVADLDRLVQNVDQMNTFDGDAWSWLMGLEERFRTGEWGAPNTIRARWHDPSTTTYSQAVDGLTKLRSVGAISVEGMWDELGWDEARKRQEKARLAEEANDPTLNALMEKLDAASVGG
jgi:hypothetical protein